MYPISKEAKEKELNIISSILHNNNHNIYKVIKHPTPQKQNTDIDSQHQKTKRTTLTYSGIEIKKIQLFDILLKLDIFFMFHMLDVLANISDVGVCMANPSVCF
jgi:predicted unusual protein kinase regulating ubiquinone biosynthesis (AarF/ABC1/UbiB family)